MAKEVKREKKIMRTSAAGVAANLLLAGFKMAIGAATGAIAIVLDAVNNLTDVASSVATMIGIFVAGKPADKDHPLGHGRAEYFATIAVSMIILATGAGSMTEAVKKILEPGEVSYPAAAFLVMTVTMITKIILGIFTKRRGKELNSSTLTASGTDALNDVLVTGSTLCSALIFLVFKVNLDGWIGAAISLLIIKNGIGMIRDTVSEMLGRRIAPEIAAKVKSAVVKYDGVLGVYDLFLDNYGPENFIGFMHIEVDERMKAAEVSELTRRIEREIFGKYGIAMTLGIYAVNMTDSEVMAMRQKVTAIALAEEGVLQIHGFRTEKKTMEFDAVISFSVDRQKTMKKLKEAILEVYPGYEILITADSPITD